MSPVRGNCPSHNGINPVSGSLAYRQLAISLGLWLTASAGVARAECGDWLVHRQDRAMLTRTSFDSRSTVLTEGRDSGSGRAQLQASEREVLRSPAEEQQRPCHGPFCGAADPSPASATPVVAPRLVDPSVAGCLPVSTSTWGGTSRRVCAVGRATLLPGVPAPILRPPRTV